MLRSCIILLFLSLAVQASKMSFKEWLENKYAEEQAALQERGQYEDDQAVDEADLPESEQELQDADAKHLEELGAMLAESTKNWNEEDRDELDNILESTLFPNDEDSVGPGPKKRCNMCHANCGRKGSCTCVCCKKCKCSWWWGRPKCKAA